MPYEIEQRAAIQHYTIIGWFQAETPALEYALVRNPDLPLPFRIVAFFNASGLIETKSQHATIGEANNAFVAKMAGTGIGEKTPADLQGEELERMSEN